MTGRSVDGIRNLGSIFLVSVRRGSVVDATNVTPVVDDATNVTPVVDATNVTPVVDDRGRGRRVKSTTSRFGVTGRARRDTSTRR